MAASYELMLQTPTAQPLRTLPRIHRCSYTRGENVAGEMTLQWPAGIYDLGQFQPFGRILIQRQVAGGNPYVDLETPWFIVDGPYRALADDGTEIERVDCVDGIGLILANRNIAYNDYTSYTLKLAPADDLLKALVRENAGSLASDTARDLTGYMNVQPDESGAPIIRIEGIARQQLLDVLQDVAAASANDDDPMWLGFDVVLADQNSGLLEFRTYLRQRGVDHRWPTGSPPVLFSDETGSLAAPETGILYGESASYIYVGGAGVGTIRAIAPASDDALIALSPFGRREKFIDGSQITDPDALQALAEAELRNARPRKYLTARINEVETALRGVHWDYGDYATASFRADTYDVRIDKISVRLEPGEGGGLVDTALVYLRGEESV